MIFLWLLAAIALTILGAVITALLDDTATEHDEELTYTTRITEQRSAIELARCEADPVCREAHEESLRAVKERKGLRKAKAAV